MGQGVGDISLALVQVEALFEIRRQLPAPRAGGRSSNL